MWSQEEKKTQGDEGLSGQVGLGHISQGSGSASLQSAALGDQNVEKCVSLAALPTFLVLFKEY